MSEREEAMAAARRMLGPIEPDGSYAVDGFFKDAALVARALLSPTEDVRREAWNAALKLAHYEVDKVLENGSPPETWDEAEKAVDRARRAALAAIDALTASKETEG